VLSNARISYILVGGRKFYERREVRDLLAYLKLVLNPADDMAFMRIVNVPTRGLGDKSISALQEEAARLGIPLRDAARKAAHQSGRAANAFSAFSVLMDRFEVVARMLSPAALIQYIARETGYLRELELENNVESQSRIENIQELARSSGDSTPVEEDPLAGLREFIDRATLSSQSDELPNESGAVTLLTVHLAKGLEYPIVFIVGLVNGLFPHARSESEREREEERRLFYVALTRAQERLFLSFPARRRFPDGGFAETELSPFLLEIPADVFAQADRAWLPRLTGEVPPRPRTPWPPINSTPGYNAPTRTLSPPRPPLRPQQTLSSTRPASPPSLPPAQSSPSLFPSSPLQPEEGNKNRRTLIPDSMEAFRPGVEVFHPTLGTGSITRRDGIPSNPRLTIHFHKHGPRTVFAAWAGLEVVL
jgi:DNA helicase-2/ATP-dependent DNA helicase PcrA